MAGLYFCEKYTRPAASCTIIKEVLISGDSGFMATKKQAPTGPVSTPIESPNSGGIIVLQWLTYAFWGWLIIGLIWLFIIILINAIIGVSVNAALPYAIAATVVMLPIAFLCDFFYRKHEPAKKTGAAMVVAVIHAVIFALIGIGSLITTVFLLLNMGLDVRSDLKGVTVGVLATGFATLLYAGALVRTINPKGKKRIPMIYGFTMLGISVLLFIFAIVGPFVTSINTRGDRQIETGLQYVKQGVDSYVQANNSLPKSLGDVTVNDPAGKALVTENKVRYVADGTRQLNQGDGGTGYRYQLCVTYKAPASNDTSSYSSDYGTVTGGYNYYLNVSDHPAGEVCYKLEY